ncbi:MAG: TonB-dependent receptor [Nitrosomonadales bacterium]|nr:TonB-dependent receptor [Nitrosomonadales bacterium]
MASSDNLLSEDIYFDDIPRVLTVSRLSQPLSDAPSAVTIIDREMIRASGVIDLPDVFRLVPGFYVGTNAGYVHSTNHVVSYQGMTSSYAARMQVLIDGRTVYEPLYGGVQWSELPIAIPDIERIEVTRGPNAASYGANSFSGVINIITQHPADAQGSMVSISHGNGRNEAFYRYGGKLEDTKYRVTLGYREDDGLQDRVDFKRTRMLTTRVDHRLSHHDELELQFGLTAGDRGEGDPLIDPIIFLARTKQIDTNFQLAKWRHNISSRSDFSIQAYRAYSRSDDFFITSDLRSFVPIISPARLQYDIDVENERYELEAQHTFSPIDTVRMVWGGSFRLDRTKAPFYLGTNKTQSFNLQQLFGHIEWHPVDRLVLNAGAMVEHNDFTGTDTSPRVSANFRLAPGHTLRAGVSTATRMPALLEEKFQTQLTASTIIPGVSLVRPYFATSGGLSPERIIAREIGYLGTYGSLSMDARIFDNDIRDIIKEFTNRNYVPPAGFTRISNPFDFTNGGDVSVRGFETQIQWRIQPSTRLIANYAKVRLAGKEDELERYFLDSAPSEIISALLSHRFNQALDASLAYYHTSRVTMLGDGSSVDAAKYWNARLARSFVSGSWKGEISANVQNLFDRQYQEFADYNTLRRRAFLTLSLDF